ncbi:hypothetical protein QUA16_16265 [Microcoleus sp. S13_C3]
MREVLHKWSNLGMEGLWELPGRGAKQTWKEEDIEFLKECLKNESRTYNSLQLVQKLEKERSVKLSADRLRRILKKKGLFGNEREKVTKKNKTR